MRVCIYTTKEQKQKLQQLSYKYQLSRSTIITYMLMYFIKYLAPQENGKEKLLELSKEYKYEQKGERTYINIQKETLKWAGAYSDNLTKTFTNIVSIYCNKDIKNYLKDTQQYFNDLNNKLQKENEPNWNYYNFRKQMAKYEKGKYENNRES